MSTYESGEKRVDVLIHSDSHSVWITQRAGWKHAEKGEQNQNNMNADPNTG